MKLEITKAQLEAITDLINTEESCLGGRENDDEAKRAIKAWDRFLKKNKLKPRYSSIQYSNE